MVKTDYLPYLICEATGENIHVELRLKYTHSKLSPEVIHPQTMQRTRGSMLLHVLQLLQLLQLPQLLQL